MQIPGLLSYFLLCHILPCKGSNFTSMIYQENMLSLEGLFLIEVTLRFALQMKSNLLKSDRKELTTRDELGLKGSRTLRNGTNSCRWARWARWARPSWWHGTKWCEFDILKVRCVNIWHRPPSFMLGWAACGCKRVAAVVVGEPPASFRAFSQERRVAMSLWAWWVFVRGYCITMYNILQHI